MPIFREIYTGKMESLDMEIMGKFFNEMALDIKKQRARIGGDWAIAAVVMFRELRDILK